jgi:hypothetical protein
MSKTNYPAPLIAEEKQFHTRNALIVKAIKSLTKGSKLKYSEITHYENRVTYMRSENAKFNTKHGLHKEIA